MPKQRVECAFMQGLPSNFKEQLTAQADVEKMTVHKMMLRMKGMRGTERQVGGGRVGVCCWCRKAGGSQGRDGGKTRWDFREEVKSCLPPPRQEKCPVLQVRPARSLRP